MKYTILRILDVAGLKVLQPIVRLCYGEKPRQQLKDIGLFIVTPAIVFALFVALWAFIAPRHKTKSGEVPTPGVVLDAYDGIRTFHNREYAKQADFLRSSEDREANLAAAKSRLAELEKTADGINSKFLALEAKREKLIAIKLAPYQAAIEQQRKVYKALQQNRAAELKNAAAAMPAGDAAAKDFYKQRVRKHIAQTSQETEHLKELRSQLDAMRGEKWQPLEEARTAKNELDQEEQFLRKRIVYLTSGNRENKVVSGLQNIRQQEQQYESAQGEQLYTLATKIIKDEERVQKIAASNYAKPPTFFDQIYTSVKCVFTGFIFATVIAIPLGVLCGLNRVFMASITPLISLFKPVSPIVWLPIVFIIVGGFIKVPEDAWIPPAFLSTAITVALCSLWPTLVNTALGVASIDQDHMNVARVLRLGVWTKLVKIVIPSALPLIFAGLRISLGVGWMVLIAGELLSSSPGLGKFVWDMFNNGSSETFAQMFVVVFYVGVIGLLLDRIMIVLQRSVTFDGAPTAI